MNAQIQTILEKYPDAKRNSLIPILQEVQETEGFLSRESIAQIGEYLRLPASKIYGVATFYNQFRFQSVGKYHIQVCRGTACHVKKSTAILDALRNRLDVTEARPTTPDLLFTVETVSCLGACGLAPVVCINDEVHGQMTPDKAVALVEAILTKEAAR